MFVCFVPIFATATCLSSRTLLPVLNYIKGHVLYPRHTWSYLSHTASPIPRHTSPYLVIAVPYLEVVCNRYGTGMSRYWREVCGRYWTGMTRCICSIGQVQSGMRPGMGQFSAVSNRYGMSSMGPGKKQVCAGTWTRMSSYLSHARSYLSLTWSYQSSTAHTWSNISYLFHTWSHTCIYLQFWRGMARYGTGMSSIVQV